MIKMHPKLLIINESHILDKYNMLSICSIFYNIQNVTFYFQNLITKKEINNNINNAQELLFQFKLLVQNININNLFSLKKSFLIESMLLINNILYSLNNLNNEKNFIFKLEKKQKWNFSKILIKYSKKYPYLFSKLNHLWKFYNKIKHLEGAYYNGRSENIRIMLGYKAFKQQDGLWNIDDGILGTQIKYNNELQLEKDKANTNIISVYKELEYCFNILDLLILNLFYKEILSLEDIEFLIKEMYKYDINISAVYNYISNQTFKFIKELIILLYSRFELEESNINLYDFDNNFLIRIKKEKIWNWQINESNMKYKNHDDSTTKYYLYNVISEHLITVFENLDKLYKVKKAKQQEEIKNNFRI